MYQRPHSCFNYYFYIHRMEESPKQHSIDALYGRSDVENKNGSLNNTIFRLRKQLTAAGLPESSYININGGMCLGPGYRNFSRRMRLQADDRISTSRKIPKDQNGNLRQSMETLHRRIPPGYDGRGLGGSRKHRMSRYVFRLCRRTVPLPENRRKIRRLYRVAHSAAEIYPFYDWQIWEIDSLIGMSRYKDSSMSTKEQPS